LKIAKKPAVMRVLITGGTGFVGRVVQEEWPDVVLWPASADLTDRQAVAQAVGSLLSQGVDAVLHLAAQSNPAQSLDSPLATWTVNLMGTVHLLEELASRAWCGSFLLASSGAVYGRVTGRIDENSPVFPSTPYAASKLAAELAVLEWAQRTKNRGLIARPFNHSGAGQAISYFLPSMAQQMVSLPPTGGEIEVGNLKVHRDFSHVRDIVRGYRLLLERGESGQIYNLAGGRSRLLSEVLDRMAEIAGREVSWVVRAERFREEDPRPIEIDLRKMREYTGWRPESPLDTLLKDLLNDWTKRRCQNQH